MINPDRKSYQCRPFTPQAEAPGIGVYFPDDIWNIIQGIRTAATVYSPECEEAQEGFLAALKSAAISLGAENLEGKPERNNSPVTLEELSARFNGLETSSTGKNYFNNGFRDGLNVLRASCGIPIKSDEKPLMTNAFIDGKLITGEVT